MLMKIFIIIIIPLFWSSDVKYLKYSRSVEEEINSEVFKYIRNVCFSKKYS